MRRRGRAEGMERAREQGMPSRVGERKATLERRITPTRRELMFGGNMCRSSCATHQSICADSIPPPISSQLPFDSLFPSLSLPRFSINSGSRLHAVQQSMLQRENEKEREKQRQRAIA